MEIEKYKRGQVWWHKPSYTLNGNLQSGERPIIIISNEKANKHSNVITVIPCTSSMKRKELPTHVEFVIFERSIALCEQITSINKNDLQTYIGQCTKEIMHEIDEKIKVALEIQ